MSMLSGLWAINSSLPALAGEIKSYQMTEGGLLDRLETMPVEKIEARAKAEGAWHPTNQHDTPANGDLVTFSLGKDQPTPHIGIVAGTKKDGTLQVITTVQPKFVVGEGAFGLPSMEPSLQGQSVKTSQIRGIISKPAGKPDKIQLTKAEQPLRPLYQALTAHRNLTTLLQGLLSDASNENAPPHASTPPGLKGESK